MRYVITLAFCILANGLFAQDTQADLQRLSAQALPAKAFGQTAKKRSFNPLSILYAGTLGLYQKQISPQWGANCAFELTCSRFSGAMVNEYGLAKGFFLTFDRMARCNKISFFETLPVRINAQGKIIDKPEFYRAR
jgi:uncharacterized protein